MTAKDGRRELKNQNVDIVIGDHAGVVSFIASLLAVAYSIPFALRLGGNIWEINREKLREHVTNRNYGGIALITVLIFINRITFRLSDCYLTISNTVERAIIKNTETTPDRIGTIGVPLAYDTFADASPKAIRKKFNLNGSRLLITVTNLRFRKKYEALRDALPQIEQILNDNEDLQFIIAGDGTYLEPLKNDIDSSFSNDVRDKVHFLGFIDDVQGLYAAADAMVYVSYEEGFGNIIQEAMAAGCPVVANDCEGLGEQITDGETGILVASPTDPELTRAITQLLYEEQREEIIQNARAYVSEVSDPDKVGQEIVAELRNMCDTVDTKSSLFSKFWTR
ncbi:glycosyltransferase family 4 protein [Saliphagus sp. GCM10025308]